MAAHDAFGTKWAMSPDGTTYTDVAEVTKIEFLAIKVDTIDVSSHDSDSQWREYVGGMKDGGELSFDINYDAAAHGTIFGALGVVKKNKITLSDGATTGTTVVFDGIVTGMQGHAPFDDKLAATVTVKVSGVPVITPGS